MARGKEGPRVSEHELRDPGMSNNATSMVADNRVRRSRICMGFDYFSMWWDSWWLSEILGLLFSFLFQGATIVILLRMQNQPLGFWGSIINLNTVIAIGTTAAKSSMLLAVTACLTQWKWLHFRRRHRPLKDMDGLDNASRGPLGAVVFFFNFPLHFASIGAAIVILALAVDSFAQQVVSFDTVQVQSANTSATLSYTHNYTTGAIIEDFNQPSKSRIDSSMLGAIYRGIYNLQLSPSFNCSGVCAWPGSYTTLGFSSNCTNVTVATWNAKNCTTNHDSGSADCTLTTPGGVQLETSFVPTDQQTIVAVNTTTLLDTQTPQTLSRLAIFRAPSTVNSGDNSIIGEEIVECDVSLTAYTYTNISAQGNSLTSQARTSTALRSSSRQHSNTTGVGIDFFIFNQTDLPDTLITTWGDLSTITAFFESPSFAGRMFDGVNPSPLSEGAAAAFLRPTVNITDAIAQMTLSMTEYIRGGPNMLVATGLTSEPVVFVRVQWPWLVLPLVAEFATLVLVVGTMVAMMGTKGAGWRGSNTALLYHYVEHPGGVLKTDVKSEVELYQLSRTTTAKLE